MIELSTTDNVYPFLMRKLQMLQTSTISQPLLQQQQQQVLPPASLDNDNIGEFDSAPISIQDFIDSVQVNANSAYTTNDTFSTGLGGNSSQTYSANFGNQTLNGTYPDIYDQLATYIPCEQVYNPDDRS